MWSALASIPAIALPCGTTARQMQWIPNRSLPAILSAQKRQGGMDDLAGDIGRLLEIALPFKHFPERRLDIVQIHLCQIARG